MQSILVFLDIAKFADSWWKIADASRTQGGGLRDLYIFAPPPPPPTIREQPQKR